MCKMPRLKSLCLTQLLQVDSLLPTQTGTEVHRHGEAASEPTTYQKHLSTLRNTSGEQQQFNQGVEGVL